MAEQTVAIRPLPDECIRAHLCTDAPRADAIRMEPGCWLVFGEDSVPGGIDVSDAYAGFAVEGAGAADLLARGIALDLDGAPVGFVGRTRLGDVAVLLWRTTGGFVLRCERSYAEWLGAWLARAITPSAGGI